MNSLAVTLCLLVLSSAVSAQYYGEDELASTVDRTWVLFAATLVFFMQAGFTMLEAGSVRVKNTKNILLKNVMDTCVAGVIFFIIGFGFGFGDPESFDQNDFIGVGAFLLLSFDDYESWFFQWGFAAATVTIISGSIAERTRFIGYMTAVAWYSAFAYPVVVHWVWGSEGWLSDFGTNGFLDFAGSGVVHSVGGYAGFVGALLVGPRMGRYVDGKPVPIAGFSTTLVTIGVFILWFGWYGFNPGSTLGLSGGYFLVAGEVAVNTTIAAGTAALTLLIFQKIFFKEWNILQALNGALAGLVAITAPCAYVEPWAAVPIGFVGAFFYRGYSEFAVRIKCDDPVDAFAVHAGAGTWGVISVGLFLRSDNYRNVFGEPTDQEGLFIGGDFEQLGVQCLGILVIAAWTIANALLIFGVLKLIGYLRVDEETEKKGVETKGHGPDSWARVEIMDNGRMDEFQFRIQ